MKYQVLFSLSQKKSKKYSRMSSAALVTGALRVKRQQTNLFIASILHSQRHIYISFQSEDAMTLIVRQASIMHICTRQPETEGSIDLYYTSEPKNSINILKIKNI